MSQQVQKMLLESWDIFNTGGRHLKVPSTYVTVVLAF
jgi:hypothetical protein